MAVYFADIEFQGMIGTIQRPKPVFEKYTRLGDDQIHVQRLRTESQESQIQAWRIFDEFEEAEVHERRVADIVGMPVEFTDGSFKLQGVFILDYTHTIRAGANSQWIIEYNLTVVCDEIEGVI